MRILYIILVVIGSLCYGQDYTPDFDISKFIQTGGISKEIYRKKNGKLELNERFYYDKNSSILKLTTHQILLDGNIRKEINFFLDSKNRIVKEEIQISDPYDSNLYMTQIIKFEYFDSHKTMSFYDKKNKLYLKEYFIYNDKKELVENFSVSVGDLVLHKRTIYYRENDYQINETETYTDLKYKTIVKTKIDKRGFPFYIESEGVLTEGTEVMPKQITYYENETDSKGNLSKVFIINDKKKELIKEVINRYE
ncbi:hypothetical protein ODZ84_01855 [Chryseobacterium fluminis]|uniref:hypothetical protein n=1 Tax=Chryseobacterium fluminis TaxID=2983606 RepID=UPI00224F8857|nr:hypothetical protein [Chryseobacterium sp. MMS21-Ot14]UZT98339.1 hypothetical protein ODZ84_01855 [Chryseobacterium sp. MMS21-Ot14]